MKIKWNEFKKFYAECAVASRSWWLYGGQTRPCLHLPTTRGRNHEVDKTVQIELAKMIDKHIIMELSGELSLNLCYEYIQEQTIYEIIQD